MSWVGLAKLKQTIEFLTKIFKIVKIHIKPDHIPLLVRIKPKKEEHF